MTQEEIIEGNKLIAKFLVPNWEELKDDKYNGTIDTKYLFLAAILCSNESELLRYHISWDAIMPVYKKCYDTWRIHLETSELCRYIFEDIWNALWKCKIDEVFENVVEFIWWWNQEIKHPPIEES